jgi:prepilin-type N-terminal cleavage/methylation domain-containing protein
MRAANPRSEAGFTLIELLVAVAVIAIIVAIAMINLQGALDRSRQRATMADMRTISIGIEIYHIDKGFMPTAADMLTLRSVLIPYQADVIPIADRWGHGFAYTADGSSYSIESYGKDGGDGAEVSYATRSDTTLDIILTNGSFYAAPE